MVSSVLNRVKSVSNKSINFDFWKLVLILGMFGAGFFILYPLSTLFISGFQYEGSFSLAHFERFFGHPFFYRTLIRSMTVSIWTTAIALIVGTSMAYFTTMYKIKGKKTLEVLIIISMLSPPFIGAYSWILLAGRNGYLARFFNNNFNIVIPDIYGLGGIVLVMSLSAFPLIYLFTKGALKKIDPSLLEASESLGCNPVKRFGTLALPLILPTVLAAGLLVFMDAFTDFGTPMLLGEGYTVMPVLIFNEFLSEMGGQPNFASALSIIMVAITAVLFLVQKYIISKRSFKSNALRKIHPIKTTGIKNVLIHFYLYAIIALAIVPQFFVVYTSFRATSGPIFVDGFSLASYERIFNNFSNAITNTFLYGLIAIVIIVFFSLFLSYLTVRKKSLATNTLDYVTMLPFVIPGSVIGITLMLAFNGTPLLLIGTSQILIIAFVIRRLPYTLRSSTAILHQISPSLEEASISLGDSPVKSFFKITAVMMMPGVISGAVLSWITIINELNASILLFTTRTRTMTVVIYQEVLRAGYGTAAALATILMVSTVISLLIFFKVSGNKEFSL